MLVLHLLALILGSSCLYSAVFLYEDEQGRIQSILEDLWIRVNDRRQALVARHTLFMREVARLSASGFDRVFGKPLFSLQAATVSACY